jgi:hypothetical protein
MRRSSPGILLFISIGFLVYLQSCIKDDASMLTPPPIPDQSFTEEFDTIGSAYDRGWRFINTSETRGTDGWFQGGAGFPAYSSKSTSDGYIWSDYTSVASGSGIISNWAVSPVIKMQNGDQITFYTRGIIDPNFGTDFGNSLQVRINPHNESTNMGSGMNAGDFDKALMAINPTLIENTGVEPGAYPVVWTKFTATVGGLNAPTKGRFALRFFVPGGGPNGFGNLIAIDSLAYIGKK